MNYSEEQIKTAIDEVLELLTKVRINVILGNHEQYKPALFEIELKLCKIYDNATLPKEIEPISNGHLEMVKTLESSESVEIKQKLSAFYKNANWIMTTEKQFVDSVSSLLSKPFPSVTKSAEEIEDIGAEHLREQFGVDCPDMKVEADISFINTCYINWLEKKLIKEYNASQSKQQELSTEENKIKIELSEIQMNCLKENPWVEINEIKYCRQDHVEHLIEKYQPKQQESKEASEKNMAEKLWDSCFPLQSERDKQEGEQHE